MARWSSMSATASCACCSLVPAGNSNTSRLSKGFFIRTGLRSFCSLTSGASATTGSWITGGGGGGACRSGARYTAPIARNDAAPAHARAARQRQIARLGRSLAVAAGADTACTGSAGAFRPVERLRTSSPLSSMSTVSCRRSLSCSFMFHPLVERAEYNGNARRPEDALHHSSQVLLFFAGHPT